MQFLQNLLIPFQLNTKLTIVNIGIVIVTVLIMLKMTLAVFDAIGLVGLLYRMTWKFLILSFIVLSIICFLIPV